MLKKIIFLGSFMLCLVCNLTAANQNAEQWIIMGTSGQMSCGKFLSLYDVDNPVGKSMKINWKGTPWYNEKYVAMQWIWGFITASNLAQEHSKKQINYDGDAIEFLIKKNCESYPTSTLIEVVNTFVTREFHGHEKNK